MPEGTRTICWLTFSLTQVQHLASILQEREKQCMLLRLRKISI
jgi:hypothetical protein